MAFLGLDVLFFTPPIDEGKSNNFVYLACYFSM
jgi:hypothetical protein